MAPDTARFSAAPFAGDLTPQLAPLVQGFFIHLQAQGFSNCTLSDYRTALLHYSRWMSQDSIDPTKATPHDIKRFLAWLRNQTSRRGKPQSPKSILNIYVGLRSFYRWAAEELGCPNPVKEVATPKAQAPLVQVLSKEQVEAVIKAAEYTQEARTVGRRAFQMKRPTAARDRAILLLLLDSGLRASELTALRISDADLATGLVTVHRGKGGKSRVSYFGKVTRKALWKYLTSRGQPRPDDPLFLGRDDRPLTPDALQGLIKNLGERAGVLGLHPHQLRHTYATTMLKNGVNLFALQRLLGHSSLASTQIYAKLAQVDLADAHGRGSPADGWRL